MKNRFLEKLASIYKDKAFRKRLNSIFFTLAAIVVFTTSYALILPAITVEKDKALENNIPINEESIMADIQYSNGSDGEVESTGQVEFIPVEEAKPEMEAGPELGPEEELEKAPGLEEAKSEVEKAEETLEAGPEARREENPESDQVGEEGKEEDPEAAIKEEIKKEEESQKEMARRTLDFQYSKRGLAGRVKVINTKLPEDAVLKISPIKEKEEAEIRPPVRPLMERPVRDPFYIGKRQGLEENRLVPKLGLEDFITTDPVLEELILEEKRDQEFLDLFLLEEIRTLDQKTQQIEEAIEGNIEEILYFDISFFTPEGEYLEVDEEARITIDLSGENLTKTEDQEITIGHFDQDQLVLLDAQVQVDEDNRVEEISFDTEGFSVFAVIKIGSWTEASLPEDEYTIITSVDGAYKAGKIVGENEFNPIQLQGQDLLDDHIETRPSGAGTERPFQFVNLDVRNNYSRFLIEETSSINKTYTIKDLESKLYLALGLEDNNRNYKVDYVGELGKLDFKFYINSKEPDKLMIFAYDRSNNKKPYILVYDQNDNNYKFINSYDLGDNQHPYHQFVKNQKELAYEKLTENELRNLDNGKYAIIAFEGDTRSLNNTTVLAEFPSTSNRHFDSIGLREEKEEGYYYSTFDVVRGGRKLEPHLWTISKAGDNEYYIQDQEGSYLTVVDAGSTNFGYLELVKKEDISSNDLAGYKFKFSKTHHRDGTIKLTHLELHQANRKLSINIATEGGRTNWHAWRDLDVTNNFLYLARLSEKPIKDTVSSNTNQGTDLIEAIVPDGKYFITNYNSTRTIRNERSGSYESSDYTNTDGTNLTGQNSTEENNTRWEIKRQADGTYRIFSDRQANNYQDSNDNNLYKLRLGNLDHWRNGFNRLVVGTENEHLNYVQDDGEVIRIMAEKDDPSAFHIFSKYGSLNIYNNNNLWASKPGDLGQPLRLYKENKERFSLGQEGNNQDFEVLAHIPDGKYVLGNSPKIHGDFLKTQEPGYQVPQDQDLQFKNKQEIDILQLGTEIGNLKGWIHYNENANNLDQFHTIEDKTDTATEWSLSQTELPGHYTLQSAGNYLDISGGSISTSTTGQVFTIYKNESQPDKVLLVQGAYRLRFDQASKAWTAVPNSEPLSGADYHYIGRKIDDYLHFELTNPEEGTNNKWLKNVRLMEVMKASDLEGNLSNNLPKGAYDELGPIGDAYKIQFQVQDQVNPYKGLYRMEQKPVPGLEASNQADNFKEYALLGWEIELNNTSYLIDKKAEFTPHQEGEIKGIKIAAKDIRIAGVASNEDLFIPYKNKVNPLKTKWREVSAPLYFYFNYGKGIMDVERVMPVKDILAREDGTNTTPILALGHLFFGEDLTESKESTSSVAMDQKLREKIKITRAIDFPEHLDKLEPGEINQINIKKVVDPSGKPLTYKDKSDIVTSSLVKESSINWTRESDKILAILKKERTEDGNNEVLFQPDKKNIKISNYDIDYLWLDRRDSGTFLQGVTYARTAELVVEKQFRNLTEEEFNKMRNLHDTSYGTNERFQIDILVDNNRASGTANRKYDDILYSLAFNRTEDGNTQADSPYPSPNDPVKAYNEIERVNTIVNKAKRTVQWRVRAFDQENFVLHEKGVDLKNELETDKKRSLHVRIEEYHKEKPRPEEKKTSIQYGDSDMKNIKTKPLTTGIYNLVKFNNLYSSGGVVLLSKYDLETKQLIKGIEFELYKLNEDGEKILQNQEQTHTSENGTIVFRDLEAGSYKLEEILLDESIYKPMEPYVFGVVEEEVEGNLVYKIEGVDRLFENSTDQYQVKINDTTDKGDTDGSTNYIDVYNKTKGNTLTIEKNLKDIEYTHYRELMDKEGQDEFYILVKGFKNGKEYQRKLTYRNADVTTYNMNLIWRIDKLNPISENENLPSLAPEVMDRIEISEEKYRHSQYPVVKRKAWFNDKLKGLTQYPYEILKEEFNTGEDASNTFKLDNIYTDTFEIYLQVIGRDKNYHNKPPVVGMEFQLYGSLDESTTDTQGKVFDGFFNNRLLYKLDKPIVEEGDKMPKFTTNNQGNARILNLVSYEGTEYGLVQSKNPGDNGENKDVVYYEITDPFVIRLEKENGNLLPKVENNSSVKGIQEFTYQNGMLVIELELDRTNYRLPETGGIGTNRIKKLALGLIGLTGTSLIYRKRKEKIFKERKNEEN